MREIDVYMVGVQPLQAFFDSLHHDFPAVSQNTE
jgi:hypothetical protein